MESTLSSYKSGRLGFAELVLARKTLSDVRAQEVELESKHDPSRKEVKSRKILLIPPVQPLIVMTLAISA